MYWRKWTKDRPQELELLRRLTHFSVSPGFVKSFFDSLYDEDIIKEESFQFWERSSDEEPGKGVTVMAAKEFLDWLKSATEESGDGS